MNGALSVKDTCSYFSSTKALLDIPRWYAPHRNGCLGISGSSAGEREFRTSIFKEKKKPYHATEIPTREAFFSHADSRITIRTQTHVCSQTIPLLFFFLVLHSLKAGCCMSQTTSTTLQSKREEWVGRRRNETKEYRNGVTYHSEFRFGIASTNSLSERVAYWASEIVFLLRRARHFFFLKIFFHLLVLRMFEWSLSYMISWKLPPNPLLSLSFAVAARPAAPLLRFAGPLEC